MATKEPWFQWWAADWLNDSDLSLCAPATRGIWADLLSHMHLKNRTGELTGRADQLARLGRCSEAELVAAVADLETTGAADVKRHDNGTVTIINRRKKREEQKRQSDNARQVRHRSNGDDFDSHASVTPLSRHRHATESKSESNPESNLNGQTQTNNLGGSFEFDQQTVDEQEWVSALEDLTSEIGEPCDSRQLLAQLAWLVCAGAPLMEHVRNAIGAVRNVSPRPAKPIAYLRRCLDESIGKGRVESLLSKAPTRSKCTRLLGVE